MPVLFRKHSSVVFIWHVCVFILPFHKALIVSRFLTLFAYAFFVPPFPLYTNHNWKVAQNRSFCSLCLFLFSLFRLRGLLTFLSSVFMFIIPLSAPFVVFGTRHSSCRQQAPGMPRSSLFVLTSCFHGCHSYRLLLSQAPSYQRLQSVMT